MPRRPKHIWGIEHQNRNGNWHTLSIKFTTITAAEKTMQTMRQRSSDNCKDNGTGIYRLKKLVDNTKGNRLLFGTRVWLTRGGHTTQGPGMEREVRALLTGAHGNQVRCKLLQNDPHDTIGINKKGQSYWWSRSAIKPMEEGQ